MEHVETNIRLTWGNVKSNLLNTVTPNELIEEFSRWRKHVAGITHESPEFKQYCDDIIKAIATYPDSNELERLTSLNIHYIDDTLFLYENNETHYHRQKYEIQHTFHLKVKFILEKLNHELIHSKT